MSIAEKLEGFTTGQLLEELRNRVRCAEKTTKTRAILVGPPGTYFLLMNSYHGDTQGRSWLL